MELSWRTVTLRLRTPFRIAHGRSDERQAVMLRLGDGLGEAAVVPYLGWSVAGIEAYLTAVASNMPGALLWEGRQPMLSLPPGPPPAQAALDMALHDLWGKSEGRPLFELLGSDPDAMPETSLTVAMDSPQAMARRAAESCHGIIKLKLGGPDDAAVVRAVRAASGARLRVDINGGWDFEQAARMLPLLADAGVELVEQPLPAGDVEGLRRLRDRCPGLPIFVDEGVQALGDLQALGGVAHGVVLKLQKLGGIAPTLRAIRKARRLGLRVMLGCMIESSLGVTAAAHLAPQCDLVDLDGPLLIAEDPFLGLRHVGGRLLLPRQPGLGVKGR
jgi:L-alanine-DL-glutamate epimerase-like enolase superfamily enzyme